MFDYHPQAIPVPYNHSNVMSDEVLFYANSEFMSRKGIAFGSLDTASQRPAARSATGAGGSGGWANSGPSELAVMLDTFRPLHVSRDVLAWEDPLTTVDHGWLEES